MNEKKTAIISIILIMVLLFSCSSKNKELNMENNKSLFEAVSNNDIQNISEIIAQNPSLELKNNQGRTALMEALYNKNNESAKLLIKAGADVNAQDNMKNSPFLYAGAEGNLEIVALALNYGANFKIFNRYGGTALIPAAEKGHIEVVKLLVNYPNFPKDHINNLGWTALLEAVLLSDGGKVHVEIVDALIKGGCNVNIADRNGDTSLDHARKMRYTEMVKLLEKAGAK